MVRYINNIYKDAELNVKVTERKNCTKNHYITSTEETRKRQA